MEGTTMNNLDTELDAILNGIYGGLTVTEKHIDQAEAKQQLKALIEKREVAMLLDLRKIYDQYEIEHTTDMYGAPIATWQGYKFFRNPISDRIESICGVRSDKSVDDFIATITNKTQEDK